MSFSSKSLIRLGQAPVGSTAGAAQSTQTSNFSYRTDDAAATVEAAGYFNGARLQLAKGDTIVAVMAMGSTAVLKNYVVASVPASGNVTISLQTTTSG